MKKLILTLFMLCVVPSTVFGQYSRIIFIDDTLTGTSKDTTGSGDGSVADTLTLKTLNIARLDLTDTTRAMYLINRIDTTYIRGTAVGDTSAWADSGYVPCVVVEYRPLLEITRGASDTLMNNQITTVGGQWIAMTDSIASGIGKWTWHPIKIRGLTPEIEVRVRHKQYSNTAFSGRKFGIRVRFFLVGREKQP